MRPVVVAVLIAWAVGLPVAVWVAIAVRHHRRSRRVQREQLVRSILYRTLEHPGRSAQIVGTLGAADQRMLEAKARALLPALRGDDRETLAQLLESRGAVDAARHKCRSHRPAARVGACRLLGEAGSSFAVLDLVPLLNDRSPGVRRTAARALGRLGQPSAVPALLGALDRRHPPPVDEVADAIEAIRDFPVEILRHGVLRGPEPTRLVAAELLGRLQVLDAFDDLVEVVGLDPSLEVRVRAARALGNLGSPWAVAPLLCHFHGGPQALRAEAVHAIGRLGAAEAVPDLLLLLVGDNLRLSESAAEALAGIAPLGVAVLEELAADDHHASTQLARRALAGLPAGPRRHLSRES
ncbi:MAG: HEAT repeat domain-containing protein [Acidimicrobiales bacterium]